MRCSRRTYRAAPLETALMCMFKRLWSKLTKYKAASATSHDVGSELPMSASERRAARNEVPCDTVRQRSKQRKTTTRTRTEHKVDSKPSHPSVAFTHTHGLPIWTSCCLIIYQRSWSIVILRSVLFHQTSMSRLADSSMTRLQAQCRFSGSTNSFDNVGDHWLFVHLSRLQSLTNKGQTCSRLV